MEAQEHDTVCLNCGRLPHQCLCLDEEHHAEEIRLEERDLDTIGGE